MHTGITLKNNWYASIILLLSWICIHNTFYPQYMRIVGHALRMIGAFLGLRVTIICRYIFGLKHVAVHNV